MRRCFLFAVSLALLALPASAAPLAADQTVKLSTGHMAKILSISKIEYSKGVMALMVRYQTSLSVDERSALSQEVDEIWKLAQKDVEHYNYRQAIISSNEEPHGVFITTSRLMNFIYEKGSDDKWTRLNSADFMAAQ